MTATPRAAAKASSQRAAAPVEASGTAVRNKRSTTRRNALSGDQILDDDERGTTETGDDAGLKTRRSLQREPGSDEQKNRKRSLKGSPGPVMKSPKRRTRTSRTAYRMPQDRHKASGQQGSRKRRFGASTRGCNGAVGGGLETGEPEIDEHENDG